MNLSIMKLHQILTYTSFLAIIGTGCSSSRPTSKDTTRTHFVEANGKTIDTNVAPDDMVQYRNSLNDLYSSYQNSVPDAFKPVANEDTEVVRNYGYRIQILSSENKSTAEAALHAYNDWIFQQKNIHYKANGYIIFKQPYYRVHIGDFLDRKKAIQFSKELKHKFPDSWMVHDNINYNQTPDQMYKHQQKDEALSDSTQVDSLKHS